MSILSLGRNAKPLEITLLNELIIRQLSLKSDFTFLADGMVQRDLMTFTF